MCKCTYTHKYIYIVTYIANTTQNKYYAYNQSCITCYQTAYNMPMTMPSRN